MDCFSAVNIPPVTWEDMCVVLRGLLDYQERSSPGGYLDQVFRVHVGGFYLGVGRISPPTDTPGERQRIHH